LPFYLIAFRDLPSRYMFAFVFCLLPSWLRDVKRD
jgi:hypothetical protein